MSLGRRQVALRAIISLVLLIIGVTPEVAFGNSPTRPAETGMLSKLPNGEAPEVAIDRLIKQAEAAQARGDKANFVFFKRAALAIVKSVQSQFDAAQQSLKKQAKDDAFAKLAYDEIGDLWFKWEIYYLELYSWTFFRVPTPTSVSPPAPGQALLLPPAASAAGIQVAFGGNSTHVPVVSGGTRVHGPGLETSVTNSSQRMAGVSAGADIVMPVDRVNFTASFGFNGFDDIARGAAPVGTSSAFTYIVPNPTSGSTGIGPTVTGQSVTIDTRGTIWDFAFGMSGRVPPGPTAAGGAASFWTYGIGVRYRNSHIAHNIRQESLTFADLNSTIDLDARSHFVAPSFAVGFEVAPRAASGLFGGISAFVAPGALITDASATQLSRCGPCGVASPEFNLVLERGFSQSTFAVMTGVKGSVGYQINPSIRVVVDGSYQYLSSFSSLAVPTSPLRQPIALSTSYSDMFSVRGSLVIAFGS